MPALTSMALAAGGLGVMGAIAGSQKDEKDTSKTAGLNMAPETDLEKQGKGMLSNSASQLEQMSNAGPGLSDVAAGTQSQRDLASMLQEYGKQGGSDPNATDISNSNSLASKLFAGQRTQLAQNFQDQTWQANQQAVLMGRSADDPILRNKLAQEQTRQQSMLDANQGGFAAQYAMQQPFQRLDFAQQRTGILSGLASQAMANRQAIANLGSGILGGERQFRLQSAQQYGNSTETSGGGLKGALQGFMAGAGTGASMAGGMGLGGMGGAAGADAMGAQAGSLSNNMFGVGSSISPMASGAGMNPLTKFTMPSMGQQSRGYSLFSGAN